MAALDWTARRRAAPRSSGAAEAWRMAWWVTTAALPARASLAPVLAERASLRDFSPFSVLAVLVALAGVLAATVAGCFLAF